MTILKTKELIAAHQARMEDVHAPVISGQLKADFYQWAATCQRRAHALMNHPFKAVSPELARQLGNLKAQADEIENRASLAIGSAPDRQQLADTNRALTAALAVESIAMRLI